MTSPYESARRVAAFLGRWELFIDDLNAAGNNVLHGVARNQLLTLDNNRYQLLLSDLRALVAAVPADMRPQSCPLRSAACGTSAAIARLCARTGSRESCSASADEGT